MTRVILHTDGAARGNPGAAAIGIVLTDALGHEIEALGEAIGKATNNEAEYRALLRGLERAVPRADEIEIRTDSELLAQQLKGTYRVRAKNLKPLHDQVQRVLAQFKRVQVTHISREENQRADALANAVFGKAGGVKDESPQSLVTRLSPTPLLVIVTGPPCAGKTTLARRIAQESRLPLVTKDDIKESLFDTLGWKDRVWSKNLGYAAFELLFYFMETQLAAGRSLIVEANFYAETMTERFRTLKARHDFVPFQILCRADSDVLAERFKSRWGTGTRHPGHVDDQISAEDVVLLFKRYDCKAMEIGGKVAEIDTTDYSKVDYRGLLAEIVNLAKASLNFTQGDPSQGRKALG